MRELIISQLLARLPSLLTPSRERFRHYIHKGGVRPSIIHAMRKELTMPADSDDALPGLITPPCELMPVCAQAIPLVSDTPRLHARATRRKPSLASEITITPMSLH